MKVVYNKEECIGCGTCLFICPVFFEMADDGKPFLKGSSKNDGTGNFELEIKDIKEEDIKCLKEAVEACPVQAIEVN